MNAPFSVAQVVSAPNSATPPKIVKVTKPADGQAITIQMDGSVKLDLTAISSEKITLVRVGERLTILFENKSTVTVEPFFDANGQPLQSGGIDLDGTRTVTADQFATIFPITDDQTVLPAAGEAAAPRNTGGQFGTFTIQELAGATPLDLLNGEDSLAAFQSEFQQPLLDDEVILPSAGEFTLVLDDEGAGDGIPNFGDTLNGDDVDPSDSQSTPEHIGSGVLPHNFGNGGAGTVTFAAMDGTSQTVDGITYGFAWDATTGILTISVGDTTMVTIALDQATGEFTATLVNPLTHAPGEGENNLQIGLTYTVTNSNGLTASGTLTLDIDDDTPKIDEHSEGGEELPPVEAAGVGEDDLAGNEGGTDQVSGSLNILWGADNRNVLGNVGVGADGPVAGDRAVAFAAGLNAPEGLTSNGVGIVYEITGGGTLLTAYRVDAEGNYIDADGAVITGEGEALSGAAVFTVALNDSGNGTFEFTLIDNLDHVGANGEVLNLDFPFVAHDSDGDPVEGHFTVSVGDGGPSIGTPQARTVDEDGLDGGNVEPAGQNGDVAHAATTRTGSLDISWGADSHNPSADNAAPVAFDRSVTFANVVDGAHVLRANGQPLQSEGQDVVFRVIDGNTIEGIVPGEGDGADRPVFRVTLSDEGNGSYTFELLDNVDHPDNGLNNENNIRLEFDFTAIDSDGDSAEGTFVVRIDDDSPVVPVGAVVAQTLDDEAQSVFTPTNTDDVLGDISPDVNTASGAAGSLFTAGADGVKSVAMTSANFNVVFKTTDGFALTETATWQAASTGADGATTWIATSAHYGTDNPAAVLVIKADGSYTFTANAPIAHSNTGLLEDNKALSFNYTVTDGDGDTQNNTLHVRINDDRPVVPVAPVIAQTLDDEAQSVFTPANTGAAIGDISPDVNAASGAAGSLFTAGADGVKSVAMTSANFDVVFKDADGFALTETVTWQAASTGADGATTWIATSAHYGTDNPAAVLVIKADGSYTFTANAPVAHSNTGLLEDNKALSFNYTVTDGDGDTRTNTLHVRVNDDKPVSAGAVTASPTLDDDAFTGGNADGNGDVADATTASGDAGALFTAGADGVKSIALGETTAFKAVYIDADGVPHQESVSWGAPTTASGGVTTWTAIGDVTGTTAATLTINADGSYSFTTSKPLAHGTAGATEENLALTFNYSVTDGDNDTATGSLTVNVNDDTPLAGYAGRTTLTEDAQANGGFIEQSATGVMTFQGGADGATITSLNYDLGSRIADGDAATWTTYPLTSGGEPITVTPQAGVDGPMLVGTLADGTVIFEIAVTDPATGAYSVTLKGPIDHPDANEVGADDPLRMRVSFTVTDGDGDTATGHVQIDIRDDGPVIGDNTTPALVEEGAGTVTSGQQAFLVDWGADDANGGGPNDRSLTLSDEVTFSGSSAMTALKSNGADVLFAVIGGVLVGYTGATPGDLSAANIVFTVTPSDSGGSYVFELRQPLDHPAPNGSNEHYIDLTFAVTATDSDGDSDSGAFVVRVDAAGTISPINYSALTSGVFVNLADTASTQLGQTVAANTATDRASVTDDVVGIDQLGNMVDAHGSQAADILVGGDEANMLTGNAGNDLLIGGKGSDQIDGGADDDTIMLGADITDAGPYGPRNMLLGDGSTISLSLAGLAGTLDTIHGGSGHDKIVLSAEGASGFVYDASFPNPPVLSGVEEIVGTSGGDIILLKADYLSDAANGGVIIDGGKGNDYLGGGAGNDEILGGSGNDVISGLGGDDLLKGGDGTDEIWGGAGNDRIYGENNNDTLYGGDGADFLSGGGGTDKMFGDAGNDTLYGSDGNDELHGGADDDQLHGEGGNDTLYGDDGNDTLYGGDNNDALLGGAGNDQVHGQNGNDELTGGAGNDNITGGSGDDVIFYNPGNGTSVVGDGSDTIDGGTDVNGDRLKINRLTSEQNTYTVHASGAGFKVDIDNFSGGAPEASLTVKDVEKLDLELKGNEWAVLKDNLSAQGLGEVAVDGDDDGQTLNVIGLSGTTAVSADLNGGNDSFYGGSHATGVNVDGGTGTDSAYYFATTTAMNVDLEAGTAQRGAVTDTIQNFENFTGSTASDTIKGSSVANVLHGDGGDDIIEGRGGDDTLYGDDGNDTFVLGADIADAGPYGPRNMRLGDGSTISLSLAGLAGTLDTIHGGSGHDKVVLNAEGASGFVLDAYDPSSSAFSGIEEIVGTNGSDIILMRADYMSDAPNGGVIIDGGKGNDYLGGGAGADTIIGGDGDDLISGLGGDDKLHGGNGRDDIWGGDGNDEIRGGGGNDLLGGDAGNDLIYGGDGADEIFGDADNDELHGEGGSDSIFGGDGNDTVYGGNDGDYIDGGAGNDQLYGQNGNDTITGGAGNDKIGGGDGDDHVLYGVGDGNDTIDGGAGTDRFSVTNAGGTTVFNIGQVLGGSQIIPTTGPNGIDVALTYGGTTVRMDGIEEIDLTLGDGGDTVNIGTLAGTTVATSTIAIEGGDGNDRILATGIDTANPVSVVVDGGKGNDEIRTGAGNDTLDGGEGNDVLSGGGGNDRLVGGSGEDRLDGGAGDDVMVGGADNDLFFANGGSDNIYGNGEDLSDVANNVLAKAGESDTAVFYGDPSTFQISHEADGHWSVHNTVTGETDHLYGIEGINFNGGPVELNLLAPVQLFDASNHLLGTYDTIQAAVDAAGPVTGAVTILAGPGNYAENVVIDRGDLTLMSSGGRGETTITGISGAGQLGTVTVLGGLDNVSIGKGPDSGFKIVGFDNGNPAVENAAVYVKGSTTDDPMENFKLIGNEVQANGDLGLVSEWNAAINGATITNNVFSGKTFTGTQPGIGDQFSVPNVPRQLVAFGQGSDPSTNPATGVIFANNEITGTAGGMTAGGQESGNSLVTIDAANSEVRDNLFTGFTNADGYALRVRGPGTDVIDNTIDHDVNQSDSRGFLVINHGQPGTYSGNEIDGAGAAEILFGTPGNDLITGDNAADKIFGGAGNDEIRGGGGADQMYGEAGNDLIYGSDGADEIYGGADNDQLHGEGGNDTLYGDDGNDTLLGGDNNDKLFGGAGNDQLHGQNGNDELTGGAGNDTITGGSGNDTILHRVGDGNDIIDGGSGTDQLKVTNDGGATVFNIGQILGGSQIVPTTGPNGIDVALSYGGTTVRMDGIEDINLELGDGGDTVNIGTLAGTTIATSTITVEGGEGDDTVDLSDRTSQHRVVAEGSNGTDTAVLGFDYADAACVKIFDTDGTTLVGVKITHLVNGVEVTDEFRSFENFEFTDGVRTLSGLFNQAPETLPASATGNEDSLVAVTLTGSDIDGNLTGFVIKSLPANGTLYSDSAGTIAIANDQAISGSSPLQVYFRPTANWSGGTSFTYAAIDGEGAEGAAATATVTLAPVADAPAVDAGTTSAVQANEDQTSSIALPTTFALTDADGSEVLSQVRIEGLPAGFTLAHGAPEGEGAWVIDRHAATADFLDALATGTATLELLNLPANFNGNFTLQITATSMETANGDAEASTVYVPVSVAPVNDGPVVSGAVTANVTEGGLESTLSALANASDVDAGTTLSVVDVPVTLPDGVTYNAANKTFTLDPTHAAYQSLAAGETTTVTVSYGVSDGAATTPATATWTIAGENDFSVVHLDADNSSGKGPFSYVTTATARGPGVSIADSDATLTDADDTHLEGLTVQIGNWKTGDALSIRGGYPAGIPAGITLHVTPETPTKMVFTGHATLEDYQTLLRNIMFSTDNTTDTTQRIINVDVNDGDGTSGTISYVSINRPPVAVDDSGSVVVLEEDHTFSFYAPYQLANDSDPDGDPISIVSVGDAQNGTVYWAGDSFIFMPAANYFGPASFTYTIRDSFGATDTATYSFNIVNVNDAPALDLDSTTDGGDSTAVAINNGEAVNITSPNVAIGDIDDTNIRNAFIEIKNPHSGDTLGVAGLPEGFYIAYSAPDGSWISIWHSAGPRPFAEFEAAIEAVTFSTTSSNAEQRTIAVSIADPVGGATTAHAYVDLNEANEAPVLIVTEPVSGIVTKTQAQDIGGIGNAMNVDGNFVLGADPDITDATTVPHVSIEAVGGGGMDYYKFTVTQAGSEAHFDIDHTDMDSVIELYDASGTMIASNDDEWGGEWGGDASGGLHSYLKHHFAEAGVYYIAVRTYGGSSVPAGEDYQLQISVENAVVAPPGITVALSDVNEDAGAPSGAVGTLVSDLVDLPGNGGLDNVTDADTGAVTGIALTGTDIANGVWWYSLDNGTNWAEVGSVSDSSALLLAADSGTRLYFQANTNWNGSIADAITFRAWDQSSGTEGSKVDTAVNGGSSAFSSDTGTSAITVTAVNDAPIAQNDVLTTGLAAPLGTGWILNETNGHYYKVVSTELSWAEASAAAQAEGGYLATITSQGEQDFIQQIATIDLNWYVTQYAWIGASDAGAEGEWKWVGGAEDGTAFWNGDWSGTASGYENWGDWEPNNSGNEDYAQMAFVFGGGWNDGSGAPETDTGYVAEFGGVTFNPQEDTPFTISAALLLANDSDDDGDTLTITSVQGAVGGTVAMNGTTITFTPTANYNGDASFTYTASDGNGGTSTATVSFTIADVPEPVNQAPVAQGEPIGIGRGYAVSGANSPYANQVIDLDFQYPNMFTDPEGGTLTWSASGLPTGFSFDPGSKQLIFQNMVAAGIYDITINATDGSGTTSQIVKVWVAGSTSTWNSSSGGAGDDTVVGGGSGSTHNGNNGHDFIDGGSGADTINGGIGNDVLYGSDNSSSFDTLNGGDGNDYLNGGANDDRLYGDNGADWLVGDGGNDRLDGGIGNDTLLGGNGRDTLIGGQGSDALHGGSSVDTFRWMAGDLNGGGVDDILDLVTGGEPTGDVIDLSDLLAGVSGDKANAVRFEDTAGATRLASDTGNSTLADGDLTLQVNLGSGWTDVAVLHDTGSNFSLGNDTIRMMLDASQREVTV